MSYDDYVLSKREKTLFLLGFTAFFAVIGYVFYQSLLTVLLMPLCYRKAEKLYRKSLAEKRKNRLLLEFRDFLYVLSSSLATGRHMEEAMEEGVRNLTEIYGTESILAFELEQMLVKLGQTGEIDIHLWTDFARRSHLEDIQDFTAVYGACRKTGGNLVFAVNKAAAVIGEKITIEREIRVMASQKKLEGRIITVLPVLIILFLQIMSPDYLQIMYTTPAGRVLMTAAFSGAAAACILIEKITRIEV